MYCSGDALSQLCLKQYIKIELYGSGSRTVSHIMYKPEWYFPLKTYERKKRVDYFLLCLSCAPNPLELFFKCFTNKPSFMALNVVVEESRCDQCNVNLLSRFFLKIDNACFYVLYLTNSEQFLYKIFHYFIKPAGDYSPNLNVSEFWHSRVNIKVASYL
jgi:hypothetical protein